MFVSSILVAALAANASVQTVSAELLSERVVARMQEVLQANGSNALIQVPVRMRDQVVPAGKLEVLVGLPAGRLPRARAAVPVKILVDGREVRSVNVWAQFSDHRSAWVYANDQMQRASGDVVRLEQRSVDATCCSGVFLDQAESVQDLRLRRSVHAGQPVLMSDFEPRPDVASRSKITISVRQGNVELALNGLALMDGRIGERISVRSSLSSHAVYGTVTAAGRVAIDE